MAETAEVVLNLDVVYVNDKLSRYATEAIKCVSSSLAAVNEFDQARLNQYFDSVDAAIAYITAQPQLDMPESHPIPHPIEPFPFVPNMESDEMDHLVRLLKAARTELINSQSARMGAGLLPFDSARVKALVGKARNFLGQYVAKQTPQDLPESSPSQPVTGPGKGGI